MTKYNENMTTLVQLIKGTFMKTKADRTGVYVAGVGVKIAKLTKPEKVPSWTKDLTLETYTKQLL